MKCIKILALFLFVIISGCSNKDDNATIENGTNPSPNLKSTGSSANDFLSASKYDEIVVEVFYVTGFQPNAQTLNNLKQFMENRLNKPGGITILQKQIFSPADTPYDINEIADLESDIRTKYNNENVLALFILFVDGNFSTDTTTNLTLGAAYRNTSCVLFENSIIRLSDSANEPNRVDLETTVVLHELCHMLGLVDLGSPMQADHLDDSHDKHCTNQSCLMYYLAESNHGIQMMASGNVPQLDANCLADLQANGGK